MVLPISVPMNILLWNCRGALNPRFHVTLKNLIDTHTPTIVIITETQVGGEKANDITDRLLLMEPYMLTLLATRVVFECFGSLMQLKLHN